jgi:hypothetical protein
MLQAQRRSQLGLGETFDAYALASRAGSAHDRYASRGDARPLCDQPAERIVGTTRDGRRRHAHEQISIALADDLVRACPRLQSDGDLAARSCLQ